MRFGVVVFPGSNRDHDAWFAVSKILGQEAEFIWHDSTDLGDVDLLTFVGGGLELANQAVPLRFRVTSPVVRRTPWPFLDRWYWLEACFSYFVW